VSWITWGPADPQHDPAWVAGSSTGADPQHAASALTTPRSARMSDEQTPVSGSTNWTSRAASQSPAMAAAMERTCS